MDDRLGEAALLERMQRALAAAGVTHGEVFVRRAHRGLARYSRNALDQHTDIAEDALTARVALVGETATRVASASINDLSHAAIVAAIHRARDLAARAAPLDTFAGFAPAHEAPPRPTRFAARTAAFTPADRADALALALDRVRNSKLTAAGLLETTVYETAVVNTAGTRRYADGTTSSFKMFALDADGTSGFAQRCDRDVAQLDVDACAREACEKSLAGRDPIALPPGEYDVVLEPPAVCELLEWLCFVTFGGREVNDGTSAFAGHLGEKVTGPLISIVDDARDDGPLGSGVPFDREGTDRERVVLIDRGVAGSPVYDRLQAQRAGRASTGHAAAPGSMLDAPVPQALQMAGGSDTLDSLSSGLEHGLHISRFHYVNGFLDPRRTLMTGLTRDGTFLVEGGVRRRGVKNMRFTDSVLEAFARIDGLTALRAAVPAWWSEFGAFVAPAVRIRGLRFTGGGVE